MSPPTDRLLRSGVVKILATSTLTTLDSETISTGINFASNAVTFEKTGFGVILQDGRILCAAETVLIPPTFLTNYNAYPFPYVSQSAPDGSMSNDLITARQIFVTVEPYCIKNAPQMDIDEKRYVYLAKLVLVEGAANMALLEINETAEYNGPNIPVQSNSYSTLGNPRLASYCDIKRDSVKKDKCCPTKCKVFTAYTYRYCISQCDLNDGDCCRIVGGTYLSNNSFGLVEDTIVQECNTLKSHFYDPSGWILTQMSVFNSAVASAVVGSPVINKENQIVALITEGNISITNMELLSDEPLSQIGQRLFPEVSLPAATHNSGSLKVAGIHRRHLKNFVGCGPKKDGCCDDSRYAFDDAWLGTYYIVSRSYIGLADRQFKGSDYTMDIDWSGAITTIPGQEYPILDVNQLPINGPIRKPVFGTLLIGAAGNPNDSFLVPGTPEQGTVPFPTILNNSPFLGILNDGYRLNYIQHGNHKMKLGPHEDCSKAVVPGYLALSRVPVGGLVSIGFSDNLTQTNKYDNRSETIAVNTVLYPGYNNYPWYSWIRTNSISVPAPVQVLPVGFPNFHPSY